MTVNPCCKHNPSMPGNDVSDHLCKTCADGMVLEHRLNYTRNRIRELEEQHAPILVVITARLAYVEAFQQYQAWLLKARTEVPA